MVAKLRNLIRDNADYLIFLALGLAIVVAIGWGLGR